MTLMKTLHPNHDLADGWEPSPPPSVGPDGLAVGPPSTDDVPPYPGICEAGPCRYLHRFELQVDAANPLAQQVPIELPDGLARVESTPGGKTYRPLPVFHTRVERYCYPATGIELELGSTSIVRCNRFSPMTVTTPEGRTLDWSSGRPKTDKNPSGASPARIYADKVKAWKAARLKEAQEAAEAELAIEAARAKENAE